MVLSQEQNEINAGFELMSKSDLKSVRLHRCHALLEGEEASLKGPFRLAQAHNSTANTIVDRILRVEVAFHFQGFDASEGKTPLFNVECSFDLDYELEEGYQPSPEAIEAFKNGNAVFNCWPYAREFVQNLTGRMSLNPPPLPLLRIVPKKAPPTAPAKAPVESTPALKE